MNFFQSIEFFSRVLFLFELTRYTSRQRYFQAYIQGCSAWKFTLECLGYFFLDMHMWLKFSVLSNSKLAWIFCSDCHSQLCTLEENIWTMSWQWSQPPKYSCSLCWLQTGCCHSHTGNCSLLAICGALIRFRDSACQKVLFPSYLTYWKVSANIEKSSHISFTNQQWPNNKIKACYEVLILFCFNRTLQNIYNLIYIFSAFFFTCMFFFYVY